MTEREDRVSSESARELSEQRILSMSPHGKTASSIEALLRRRSDELAQAIRDKDIDQLMTFYATDVVAFDVRPPLDARGIDTYRENFVRWFASFEGPLGFEFKELRIVPGEDVAFCHYLGHITGANSGRKSGYWIRGTTCFERRHALWLITHEHISMPLPISTAGTL